MELLPGARGGEGRGASYGSAAGEEAWCGTPWIEFAIDMGEWKPEEGFELCLG